MLRSALSHLNRRRSRLSGQSITRFDGSRVALCVRRALEEERYWHLQNVGDLLQPARSDAVGALLVFLHLPEGETEAIGQLLLAHCKHHAAHAHPTAIDGPLRGS